MADFLPDTIGRFKAALADLTSVTQYQVDKARGILGDLMGRQIVLHPTADGKARYLTAEVSGDYAGLLKLVSARNHSQNKSGGGEPTQPALTPLLGFKVQGVAFAAYSLRLEISGQAEFFPRSRFF